MNKLKANYNRFMSTFSKSFPSEMKNNKLVPTEIKKGDLSFFGESNPKAKEGRGVFYDAKNDMILVTTWRDQDDSSFGQIYNNLGNLVYEGEMINGVAHGKGTFFFPGGEKYYGNFENGVIEGNGIFYWEDGSRWEGTFSNNKLHGDGVFYNPKSKSSFNASYKNNRLIEESNTSVFTSMRKKDRRERDRDSYREKERDSYKEKEERETTGMGSRRMLFRGRGKGRDKRERGGDRDVDLDRDVVDKEIEIEKEVDKDGEREVIVEREIIEVDNDDNYGRNNTNKLGSGLLRSGDKPGMMRFKKKEVYREKNQREFEREKPKDERESEEENNEEEDERESEKDEEPNYNNREVRKFRMEMGKSNRAKGKNRGKDRNRNKKESDEEESDE